MISYIKKVYSQNEKLLKKGFTPETNNVMEQFFSLISDIITQARSFKNNDGYDDRNNPHNDQDETNPMIDRTGKKTHYKDADEY